MDLVATESRGIMFRGFLRRFSQQEVKMPFSYGFTMNADRLPHLGFSKAVDLLYDIRCDVVHEGDYTTLYFTTDKTQWSILLNLLMA
jgi:hypothetical protein